MKIKQWIGDVRERFVPAEGEYLHASEVPDEPEGPYRARLERGAAHATDGVEVGEREMVRGQAELVYLIRCECGRRWFTPRFENLHTCPKCNRAVLVQQPPPEPGAALQ
jgi:hypothetical protein